MFNTTVPPLVVPSMRILRGAQVTYTCAWPNLTRWRTLRRWPTVKLAVPSSEVLLSGFRGTQVITTAVLTSFLLTKGRPIPLFLPNLTPNLFGKTTGALARELSAMPSRRTHPVPPNRWDDLIRRPKSPNTRLLLPVVTVLGRYRISNTLPLGRLTVLPTLLGVAVAATNLGVGLPTVRRRKEPIKSLPLSLSTAWSPEGFLPSAMEREIRLWESARSRPSSPRPRRARTLRHMPLLNVMPSTRRLWYTFTIGNRWPAVKWSSTRLHLLWQALILRKVGTGLLRTQSGPTLLLLSTISLLNLPITVANVLTLATIGTRIGVFLVPSIVRIQALVT